MIRVKNVRQQDLNQASPGMSVNTKMEHRTLAWVLVIIERAWFFSVHLDSMQQEKIDVLRKDLFHCERFRSRGLKPENSADEPCFNVFTCFDGMIKLFQAGWAPRARTNSKENHLKKKISSSTARSRLVPRGPAEGFKISDWSVGGSNPLQDAFYDNFFFFFVLFLFVRFEKRGTTFDRTFCWIKFRTMVAV